MKVVLVYRLVKLGKGFVLSFLNLKVLHAFVSVFLDILSCSCFLFPSGFFGRDVANSPNHVIRYIAIMTKLGFDLQFTKEYAWP